MLNKSREDSESAPFTLFFPKHFVDWGKYVGVLDVMRPHRNLWDADI